MTDRHDLDTLLAESAWVRSLARSLTRSDTDADDLVQDAWTAALRRPPSADRPVRPWLAAVVRNAARARFRGAARRSAREDEVRRREGDVPSADALLGELEMQEQLSALVRGLPEPQREAVVLRYHEGLSGADIARRLSVPAGTVRWRIKSGLDALRAELDRRSDGDRAAWLGALTPLVRPRGAEAAPVLGVGALVVLSAQLATAAAAAVALIAFVLVPLLRGGGGDGGPGALPPVGDGDVVLGLADGDEAERPAALDAPDVGRLALEPRAEEDEPAAPGRVETTLRLRAVDPTGAPVADAAVELRPSTAAYAALREELEAMTALEQLALQAQLRARTDGRGVAEFRSTLLRVDSSVTVDVLGPRNGSWSTSLPVSPGDVVDIGDAVLEPRGRVIGTLTGPDSKPAGGWIYLAPPDADDTKASALAWVYVGVDGRFEAFLDEAATVQIHVQALGVSELEPGATATVELGATVEMDVRTAIDAQDAMPRLIALDPDGQRLDAWFEVDIFGTGTVRTSGPAQPDDGFRNAQFLTDAERVVVRARDTELRHRPKELEFRPPFGDFVLELEPVSTRTVRVEVGVAERGGVDDLVLDIDAFEARLTVRPQASSFELELPATDDAELFVRACAEGCVPLELSGLRAADLPDPWHLVLEPLPGVVGRVTFQGQPVPRARLRASHVNDPGEWSRRRNGLEGVRWASGHDDRAARDGTFDFPLQWEGDWVLRVRARGYADALVDLSDYDPAAGRVLGDVELVRPGEIVGQVLDAAGAPRAGVRVVASHAEHEARVARTNREGRYRLRGVPPGDWMVVAPHTLEEGSGWSTFVLGEDWELPTNVAVTSGASATLDLGSTLRGVTIRLDVTGGALSPDDLKVLQTSGADGDPLMLFEPQRTEATRDGAFELLLPAAGSVDVSLRSAGFRGSATWTLDCATIADEVMLDLPLATLDVRGEPGTRVVMNGTPIREGAPRVYHAVTLDESGAREGVLIVASDLTAQVAGDEQGAPTRFALEPGTRQRLLLD